MTPLIISGFFGAASWAFVIVDTMRERYARGTQKRYVLATIEWALVPFMATQPLWMAMANAPKWLWILCTLGNYLLIYLLYRDDDDNWWKRKKKKLKTWVQSMSKKPVTAGAHS